MKVTRNKYHYQIRRCKRIEDFLRNKKIFENCFDNDLDLFKEIKKQRQNGAEIDITIDGSSGKEIPQTFARVYEDLYNNSNDDDEIEKLESQLNKNLRNGDKGELEKINSFVIKEAMDKIKPNKSDPLFDFSSDCLKNAPVILYDQLADLLKSFLVHSHVPNSLLTATLVPIVKDKLGDLGTTKNYRSIAISSLLLKLIDWVVMILYGDLLKANDLQFGFQQCSSTSLCSWMALETIDNYLSLWMFVRLLQGL